MRRRSVRGRNQRGLENLRLVAAAGDDAGDDPDDEEEDEGADEEDEPDRADEDDFFDGTFLVEVGDGLSDAEEAELGGVFPEHIDGAGGVREDGGADGADDLVIFGDGGRGHDFLVSEKVADGEGFGNAEVDVAGVFEDASGFKFPTEHEAGERILCEFALFAAFTAFDMAVNERGELSGELDRVVAADVLSADDDSSILAAAHDVFRNGDVKFDLDGVIGFDREVRFGEGDPIFELCVGIFGREIGIVSFVRGVIRRGFDLKIEGNLANVIDGNGANVGIAGAKLDVLLGRVKRNDEAAVRISGGSRMDERPHKQAKRTE